MTSKWSITWVTFLTILPLSVHGQTSPPVSIHVVEGASAINSIKLRRGHDPVVQVVNGSGEPIAGATVTFLLPASGASGTFADNSLSVTVQTDSRGMAAGRGLKPNKLAGQFRIRVTTSWRGEAATASLMQTNAEPEVKSNNSKWVVIAVVVGGAAAGGALAATRGGGSTASPSTPVPTTPSASTIVAGTPSFGPPR
jgi:hypothetical protein